MAGRNEEASATRSVDKPVSWASSPAIRRTMVGNRRRDTVPELAIRRLLHRSGLRYRVDWKLPIDGRRRADIVFTRHRLVVFIDGCFWHGCPEHYVPPRTNPDYWADKIAVNVSRDRDTDRRLGDAGWTVLRFWEHEDAASVVLSIQGALAHTRSTSAAKGPSTEMMVRASESPSRRG